MDRFARRWLEASGVAVCPALLTRIVMMGNIAMVGNVSPAQMMLAEMDKFARMDIGLKFLNVKAGKCV